MNGEGFGIVWRSQAGMLSKFLDRRRPHLRLLIFVAQALLAVLFMERNPDRFSVSRR